MDPEKKRKAEVWWARQLEKFPQLAQKYGQELPLDENGLIPRHIVAEVQTSRQAQTYQVQPPEPVNWAEAGRDVLSGLGNIATIPQSFIPGFDPQQQMEEAASEAFGVEPRDLTVPEDAGILRKMADPIVPIVEGIGAIDARFLQPAAALFEQHVVAPFMHDEDPWEVRAMADQLREQGYGPMESLQASYEQADIPWPTRLGIEILSSPEELIPGYGMYAGATRVAGRQLGKALGREVAGEVAEEAAPVVAREMPEIWKQRQREMLAAEEAAPGFVSREAVEEAAPVVEGAVPEDVVQLGLRPVTDVQPRLGEPLPEQLAPDVPVSQLQGIQPSARAQIDDIIGNVTETSPNKTAGSRLTAQGLVQNRFDSLISGSLNDAQSKKAATYIARQAGTDAEEIRRLAGQAVSEETFGPRLTPDEQLIETVTGAIEPAYSRQPRFTAEAETQVDSLIGLRQEGKHQMPGYKSFYGRLRNQTAQTVDMTPGELDKYIDEISQGQLPGFEDLTSQRISGDPQYGRELDRYVVQLELPLLRRGSKPKQVEESIAQIKNEGYPIPSELTPSQSERAAQERLIRTSITLDGAIRELLTPDEMAAGLTLDTVQGRTAAGSQLVTKYEGTLNSRLNDMQNDIVEGARKMEALGFGERVPGIAFATEKSFLLKVDDWGTREIPGPIRFLYRALHGEVKDAAYTPQSKILSKDMWITGRGMPEETLAHPAMAPEKAAQREEIFNNLKQASEYEEAMRMDFDIKLQYDGDKGRFIQRDYFYRGWKAAEGVTATEIRNNMSAIASTPSFKKARTNAMYWEMEQAGFEPLFRDPFQQAAYSQQMGLKYRMQTELVEHLKNELVGIAHPVTDKKQLDFLHTKYGMRFKVPDVGPAFTGKGHAVIEFTEKGEKVTDVKRVTEWAVPEHVANTLESIFHGGATSWQKSFDLHVPLINKTYPINVAKLIDGLVFIPKRIKLFASLFQVTDFSRRAGVGGFHGALEAIWSGLERGMTPDEAFEAGRVAAEAAQSVGSIGKAWVDMWGGYFTAGKSTHYRNLLRSTDTTGINAVIEGGGTHGTITWDGLVRNGLNVRDLTILPGEDMAQLVDRIASNASFPKKMFRHVKELEYSSRRGLFDRVYPAAIMTDVKYNLIPIARRSFPNATDDQIMALVARQANLKYSTLLRSQSNLNQFSREVLSRVMFSVNENESLIRQILRVFKGTEKGFWAKYWVSAGVFFITMANAIHFATSLVTDRDASFKERLLPKERYVPIYVRDKGWPIGYNSRFLAPDIPLRTRSGERAVMDMLGQLDTAFRMLSPIDFVTSRQGATMGSLQHLYSASDFYGRETDKFGHIGRAMQFAYDIGVPIGMGEAVVGLTQKAFGDVELPTIGAGPLETPFIAPGATIKDILPVSEQALGIGGMLAEATGENIKAPTNRDLQRRMILNTYPDSDIKSFKDLDRDKELKVMQDINNQHLVKELETRTAEGAAMDDVWDEQRVERDASKGRRMQEETDMINEYEPVGDKTWDPTRFRADLKNANLVYRTEQDMISKKFNEDPVVAMYNVQEPSEEVLNTMRLERPLDWTWHQYVQLFIKHTEGVRKMDNDKFNDELEAMQDSWGEELSARFDVYRAAKSEEVHTDKVNEYYRGMRFLEEVGWFENEQLNGMIGQWHQRMPKQTDGTGLREVWDRWLKGGSTERARIEQTSGYKDTIKIIKKYRDEGRQQILMNPSHGKKVDKIVIEWFKRNPLHTENLLFYRSLYGRVPRSMAATN